MQTMSNPMMTNKANPRISSDPKGLILGLGDLFSALTNLPTLAGKRAGEEAAKLTETFAKEVTALLLEEFRAELLRKLKGESQAPVRVKRKYTRRASLAA